MACVLVCSRRYPLYRDFPFIGEQDAPGATHVAVVSETFATRFFPHEDAIGKRIHITNGPETWREIVGIVGDTKHYGLNPESKSQMYEPMAQHPFTFMTFVVKTSGAPMALSRTVEARIQNGHWPLRRIRADALHGIRCAPQKLPAEW